MFSGPTAFLQVAQRLQTAIIAGLTTPVVSSRIVAGQITWDACDCGMLTLSVTRTYFSETFPTELGNGQMACHAGQPVADLTIQVIRCAPGPDDNGNPPTAAADLAAATLAIADLHEVSLAVVCALAEMVRDDEIDDFLVQPATAQGPSGNCVGMQIVATVGLVR